ncbi:nucleoside triphosphate pyrophosphohydrolase family protein [Natronorubrum halophilum]|nr:hypothetical protein [Natronorubrum halophilum]
MCWPISRNFRAIRKFEGFSARGPEALRAKKADERGGFTDRLVL